MRAFFLPAMGVVLLALCACTTPSPRSGEAPTPVPDAHSPVPTRSSMSASPVPIPDWPAPPGGSVVLYDAARDPDRPTFITDPRSHKTDWQLRVVGSRPAKGCHAIPPVRLRVTLLFLDDRQGRWFPQEQTLTVRCGQTTALQPSAPRSQDSARWVFQAEPSLTVVQTIPSTASPHTPLIQDVRKLPLGALWLRPDLPVTLDVRWRWQTVGNTVSAWNHRTIHRSDLDVSPETVQKPGLKTPPSTISNVTNGGG